MKVIGFSSGAVGQDSNVDRMVRAIMESSGHETEFVKLNDLNYNACKSCVWLCAEPQLCQLEDDLFPYYQKLKEADAVVLGAAVHMDTVNTAMLAFISRLWGFRHVSIPIRNKPFVLALSAGAMTQRADDTFRTYLRPYGVKILDVVSYSSAIMPCYRCGRHQECKIGGAYRFWREKACTLEITPDLFRQWEDHPETVEKVKAAGNLIAENLNAKVESQPPIAN
ncbi:MAG: flavodoxin family protein [Proteobacteria bacterium]|nr:flavodoxin family protein [Pseudomonadota bacterium]